MKKTPQVNNKAAAFVRDKAATVVSNVGFYLLLALDIIFLTVFVMGGFTPGMVAALAVTLAAEVVAVLFLLPVPLIQVGLIPKNPKNIVYAVIFAIMPVIEFAFAMEFRGYGELGAVYGFFAAARVIMLLTTFLSPRSNKAGSVAMGGVAVFASIFLAIMAFGGAGTLFDVSLSSRPLSYGYSEGLGGYVVTDAYSGVRDNVRVPATYKGEPVVGVTITYAGVMKNLDIPASVKQITLQSDSLENLTVRGGSVAFGACDLSNLKSLRFTSDVAPRNLPFSEYDLSGDFTPSVHFTFNALNAAMRSEDLNYAHDLFELDTDSRGSVIYYTDCGLYESGVIDGLNGSAVEFDGESISTPVLDLESDGYAFLGWYSSRDYTGSPVVSVSSGEHIKLYAKYLKLYPITLYDFYGEVSEEIKYHREMEVVLPQPKQIDGYEFCGWYYHPDMSDNKRVKGGDIKSILKGSKGKMLLSPEYKKIYTITVHDEDCYIFVDIPESYHEWSDEILLPIDGAKKVDYTFVGWYLDADFTEKIEGVPLDAGKNLDIYPKFNKNYTISVDTHGGSDVTLPDYYHKDSDTIILPSSTRTGYKFDGWYKSADYLDGDKLTSIEKGSEGDITLHAKWSPVRYKIEYSAGAGVVYTGYTSDSFFTYDAADNTLNACGFSRKGYTFAGWRIANRTYQPGVNISENFASTESVIVVATAVWTPITYTVKYLPGDGGVGEDMESSTFTFDSAGSLRECKYTRMGYHFIGWYIEGNTVKAGASGVYNFASVQDAVVQASALWAGNEYSIRYVTGVGGDFTETCTFDANVTIAKCPVVKEGYTFSGWEIGGRTYNEGEKGIYNFTSNEFAVITATAKWTAITYTVKYSTGVSADFTETYTYDQSITLPQCADTQTGFTFSGWSIKDVTYQAGSTGVYNFASTSGAEVLAMAVWTPVTYTVHYAANGDDVEGSTEDSTFVYNANANELRACGFTREGYEFVGWSTVPNPDSETIYPAGEITDNLSTGEDVTLYAIWRKIGGI